MDTVRIEVKGGPPAVGSLRDRNRETGVVVVPGVFCHRELPEIRSVVETLAVDHDTLALDMAGHGDAPGRFTWGREEWRQVTAAVEFLGGPRRKVSVVGFSFGGFHAARAASRGAPVRRLVLVGAPADLRVLDHFPLGPRLCRHLPYLLRRPRRGVRLEWPRDVLRRRLDDDELARIEAQTLVIHGESDWLVSERHARRYASAIPGARLHVIPRGLHAEFLAATSPSPFLSVLRNFLRP